MQPSERYPYFCTSYTFYAFNTCVASNLMIQVSKVTLMRLQVTSQNDLMTHSFNDETPSLAYKILLLVKIAKLLAARVFPRAVDKLLRRIERILDKLVLHI